MTEKNEHGLHACSKHNCGGSFINVMDKRAAFAWTSLDPLNERGYAGKSILDMYPEEVREEAHGKLVDCIVDRKGDSWIVERARALGDANAGRLVNVKVTLTPFDRGELAGISLVTVLPDNYFDLTRNDFTLLRLLTADKTIKEIANEMGKAKSTIDKRIRSLKKRLGCKTIAGLAAKAVWSQLT